MSDEMKKREEIDWRRKPEDPCNQAAGLADLYVKGQTCDGVFRTLEPRLLLELPDEEFQRFCEAYCKDPNLQVSFAGPAQSYGAAVVDPRCGQRSTPNPTIEIDSQGRVQVCCTVTDGRYIVFLSSRDLLEFVSHWCQEGKGVSIGIQGQEDPRTASVVDVRCGSARWSNSRSGSVVDTRCGSGPSS